jgi:DNA-binding FadR family transcriptional regulator
MSAPSTSVTDPLFQPVRAHPFSQIVVDQVKKLLRDGRLKPGDKLPHERTLRQQLLVGRATLREAMRVLEGCGLVQVRSGWRRLRRSPDEHPSPALFSAGVISGEGGCTKCAHQDC